MDALPLEEVYFLFPEMIMGRRKALIELRKPLIESPKPLIENKSGNFRTYFPGNDFRIVRLYFPGNNQSGLNGIIFIFDFT